MRNLTRILPFLLCIVLAVSAASSFAYAAEAEPPGSETEGGEGEENPPAGIGMEESTAELGKTLMAGIWSLFGISVPGFHFTFGQFWAGVFLASVSILVIRMIFGFGGSGASGVSSRTSSTDNPRISKERRHDEF